MQGDRIIFHCDCNGFYASVEELLHPTYRGVPMAVTWSPDSRRGVILAKNELAKGFGVQTAESVGQAIRKCPNLVLAPAHHSLYRKYSGIINGIYESYTDRVERFGIDESYLDVTGTLHLFHENPVTLAHEIRRRVEKEVGLTISVGVSFNKTFAKIGSDYKKPNAVTYIGRENYRSIVWPLPVSALLYVGKVTGQAMEAMHIHTIGDLAAFDRSVLAQRFGRMGEQLHRHANGEDDSPVASAEDPGELQSVGDGLTFSRNLESREDIRTGVAVLADSVASRLRHGGVKCAGVQVTIKDPDFKVITRQMPMEPPTWLAKDLMESSMLLIEKSWPVGKPIRMLTVTGLKILPADSVGEQMTLFGKINGSKGRDKQERLEKAMDRIRDKYGGGSLSPASVVDNNLGIHGKGSTK